MANVMIIQGKVRNVWDENDFADMLRELLGSDAEHYFRALTDREAVLSDISIDDVWEYACFGECQKLEEQQEHYEGILRDVKNDLDSLYYDLMDQTKEVSQKQIMQLIQKINAKL